MHVCLSRTCAAVSWAAAMLPAVLTAQTTGTALVRHAPSLNGTVEGSVQQMTAEAVTLNSGATVTGDLLVPGEPSVRLNGKPSFGGVVGGQGAPTPTNYTVTLNGNVQLRNLRTRTDAVPVPVVAPAASPAGTRSVTLNSKADRPDDFATVRNLMVNGKLGQVAVPPGAYGDFTANGESGFTLGVTGATQPAIYSFQHLTLNGNGALQVAGPVVITIANGVTANGAIGTSAHPEWLSLRVANGGLTLNGGVAISGYVLAPAGTVIVNGNCQLIGGLTCDRLTLNGNGLLRLLNAPPAVAITAPSSGFVAPAPIASLALAATAADADGYITKVEFYSGSAKLGESTLPPHQFTWTAIPAGTFSITARATDNSGAATTSAPVVVVSNQPPLVSLTAPVSGTVVAPPAQVTLSATATDLDGTIAKVAFYVNDAKVGESAVAPFQFTISGLALGSYKLFARATDNYGATADSGIRSVVIETPPTAAISAPTTVSRGAGVPLTASAVDPDGSIAKVEFYRGTKLVGTVSTPTGNPPVFMFTDTEALAPGTYAYTVRSYDNLGLFTDSAASTVAVLATLPYMADFESSEGYALGPLDKQLGWTATGNGAAITDQGASNGVRSIALAPGTPPVRVAQMFAPFPGHDVVYVDFFARPVAQTDVTASTTFDVEGARFAFAQTGASAVLNAFDGNGAGGGAWRLTSFSAPIGADAQLQAWIRLTARLDFAHKTWDLYAAGNMVGADLKLRDGSATYLSSFAVRGDAATVSRLDYIFAGADNPLFADVNNNGVDDAWETAHGLMLTAFNRTDDADGDGLTTLNEYLGGTDPRDYYNGVAPGISIESGDNQSTQPGEFNAQPFVVVVRHANGTPLSNAPVDFAVTSGAGGLALTQNPASAAAALSVRTNASGMATVHFLQPPAAGIASTITAKAGMATVAFHTTSVLPNVPPLVRLTTPEPGLKMRAPATLRLAATAGDTDGTVTKVQFYANAALVGASEAPPYACDWSNIAPGMYTLTAVATDNANMATTSTPVDIVVGAPVLVSLTAPANNTEFPPGTTSIALTATASVVGGTIARVEFLANGSRLGETSKSPFVLTWSGIAPGAYLLTARATDDLGFCTISDPITISIPSASLPLYATSFESSEGYVDGSIDGQGGWQVAAGQATVAAATAVTGVRTLVLGANAHVRRSFSDLPSSSVVFVELYVRPTVGTSMNDSTSVNFGPALITFRQSSATEGELVVGQITDGFSYTNTGFRFPITSGRADNWLRITLREDFERYVFDVYANGKVVLTNQANYWTDVGILDLVNGPSEASFDALTVTENNPCAADSDRDGIDDAYELMNGMNPMSNDRDGDIDGDGLANVDEYVRRTRANASDSDGDGLPDGWEVLYGYNPAVAESPSILEADSDHDGLSLVQESHYATNPSLADTDGDGMPDGWEIQFHLNPAKYQPPEQDTDEDLVSDLVEYQSGTSPIDFYNGEAPQVSVLTGGNGQLGPNGEVVLEVRSARGDLLRNAPLDVSSSDGTVRLATSPWSTTLYESLVLRADVRGRVTVYIRKAGK